MRDRIADVISPDGHPALGCGRLVSVQHFSIIID
jgi:hypothetical protein